MLNNLRNQWGPKQSNRGRWGCTKTTYLSREKCAKRALICPGVFLQLSWLCSSSLHSSHLFCSMEIYPQPWPRQAPPALQAQCFHLLEPLSGSSGQPVWGSCQGLECLHLEDWLGLSNSATLHSPSVAMVLCPAVFISQAMTTHCSSSMQVFGSNTLQLFWTTAAHQVHHLRSHLSLSLSSDAGLGRRSQGLFTWVLYHLTGVQTSKGENLDGGDTNEKGNPKVLPPPG